MVKYRVLIVLMVLSLPGWGQSTLGQWNEHLPFGHATKVVKAGSIIYCATQSGLFEYDTESFVINKWSKVNGLSGVDIATMAYSEDHRMLIIAYANSNIDILVNRNDVMNIPDIKQKQITGSKRINSIRIYQDQAFVSCGFGIIVLNLIKGEISSTYYIGQDGEQIEVFETIVYRYDSLFAATEKGIRKAFVRHPNLENYVFWEDVADQPYPQEAWHQMAYNQGKLFAAHRSTEGDIDSIFTYDGHHWEFFPWYFFDIMQMHFNQDRMVVTSAYQINIFDEDGSRYNHLNSYGFDYLRAEDALLDEQLGLWIADGLYGLLHSTDYIEFDKIRPNGPWDRRSFDLVVADNDLWVAGGGYDGAWNNVWINSGVSAQIDGTWASFNPMTDSVLKDLRDVVRLAVNPANSQQVYAASWGLGLMEFNNGNFVKLHDDTNTDGALQSIFPGHPYIRIGGMAFDSENNLWVSNSSVTNPVSVRKTDGSWKSFPYGIFLGEAFSGEMVITPGDVKWVQLPKGNGLFAFHNGDDLDDTTDDRYQKITVRALWPAGTIKVINNVFSLATDLDGRLWVGTANGVTVYYAPHLVFDTPESNFYSSQPSVDLGDSYYHALLETEMVTAIAVDGANRKWFGTRNSGVFLTNPEGTELIQSFNTLNSPLLSNNIFSIAIDHESGEVYFGTEAGIVSFRGDAIRDDRYEGPVYAFPNPVRPEYDGPITVRGLAAESIVKITDINGNLVFETESLGGQAVWHGKDLAGNRAHTGVYLVFSATANAQQKSVAKILFIH